MNARLAFLLAAAAGVVGFLVGRDTAGVARGVNRRQPATVTEPGAQGAERLRPGAGPRGRALPPGRPSGLAESASGDLLELGNAQDSLDPLDRIPWQRHLGLFARYLEAEEKGPVHTQPELMGALAGFLADLGPAFAALGTDDIHETMSDPRVLARVFAAAVSVDAPSAAEARARREETRQALLGILRTSRFATAGEPVALAAAEATHQLYSYTLSQIPEEEREAFERVGATALHFASTEVRLPLGADVRGPLRAQLFGQGWGQVRQVQIPPDKARAAQSVFERWLMAGRDEVNRLRATYGEAVLLALRDPKMARAPGSRVGVALQLRLRIAMARLQARYEQELAQLLGEEARSVLESGARSTKVFIVSGYVE